jgi:hypothetical protein
MSGLEEKVEKESKGLFARSLKRTLALGVAVGAGALSYGLVGIGAPLTGAAFAIGSKLLGTLSKNPDPKSKGLEGLLKDFAVGSLAGIVGVAGYDLASYLFPEPGIARALFGLGVANPTFTAAYMAADYTIKNDLNTSGIGKHFRENFWPVMKDITLYMGLPVALTINGYGIPATVGGLDLRGYPSILPVDIAYRVVAGLSQQKNTAGHAVPAHAH